MSPAPSERTPLPAPFGFRGSWLTGPAAAEAASRVSGPFRSFPTAFAGPSDIEDLSRILETSRREELPIIPRGGGTGMPGGNLGRGIVVDLSTHFQSIGALEEGLADAEIPAREVEVEAGALAGEVEAVARAAGLRIPFLPSSALWCTVGGMAANNAAGARSFRYGPAAAWVVALEGLDVEGRPFRWSRGPDRVPLRRDPLADLPLDGHGRLTGWPAVRKNASGYGLDRFRDSGDAVDLLVGSEGTLALLTRIRLRLGPAPRHRGVHLLSVASPEELEEVAMAAPALGASACEFLGRRLVELAGLEDHPQVGMPAKGAYGLLLLEFEGDADRVDRGLAEAERLSRGLGVAGLGSREAVLAEELWSLRRAASPMIHQQAARGLQSTQFIEDSVVPVHQLAPYLRELEEILARNELDAVIFGHAGDGNLHVNPLVEVARPGWRGQVRSVLEEVTELVASLGGTLSGEHGDGRVRAPFLPAIWPPHLLRAFHDLKDQLDPCGLLNPGVVLPLPGQDPLEDFRPRPRSWPDRG